MRSAGKLGAGGLALLAGLLLAACGAPPTGEKPVVSPSVAPIAPVDPGAMDAQIILQRVLQTSEQAKTWTATAYSELITPTGARTWTLARMCFKRPDLVAATVTDSDNSKVVGTKLVYDTGDKVQVRTMFFGFFKLRLTLDMDDEHLVDAYHRTLRDNSTAHLFDVLRQGQARRLGSSTISGEPVEMLEVHSPASWKDVSREVVGISTRLCLPIYREVFDLHNRKMQCIELRGMKTNVAFSSKEFTLD